MNKTEKIIKRIAASVIALCILAITFFAGFFTHLLTMPVEVRDFMWMLERIKSSYYQTQNQNELFNVAVDAIIDKLDVYSEYFSKEDVKIIMSERQGQRLGFGFSFLNEEQSASDGITVFAVSGNSPAERAGLKAGDVIIGAGQTQEQITLFNSYQAAVEAIRAIPANQTWHIKTRGSIIEMAKQEYEEGFVYYGTQDAYYGFQGQNGQKLQLTSLSQVQELLACDSQTAYIKLTSFSGNAATQFGQAMAKLKQDNKTKLILDLRNNGGGYMDILVGITEHLVASSTKKLNAAISVDKFGNKTEYTLTKSLYNSYNIANIAVLANINTASASECLIGALIDYDSLSYDYLFISKYDGLDARTYGKGIMQTTYTNSTTGSALKLTTANILWPVTQISIHTTGITGIAIAASSEHDNELAAAIIAQNNFLI